MSKIMPLVKRGVNASRLALGCMPFGGSWDSQPFTDEHVKEAEAAVEAALDIGITMFDHADIYTRGKAEQVFGRILQSRPELRQQMVIQSKCGIQLQDDLWPGRFNFSREHIVRSVDASLERLGIDYLDVLLLHRPDPLVEPDEVAEALAQLKAAGKVRYFGVSNMSAAQIEFLQQAIPDSFAVNQLEMSLGHLHFVDQDIHVNQNAGTSVNFGAGLMEYCRSRNIQLQAWSPLARGKFSGLKVDQEPEHIRQTAALVQRMADEKETTAEAIVLGWLMRHPALIQPIIGTTNPKRIAACQDAERQAEQMSRDEWYLLYTSARGQMVP
ncbi:aldo/keto reductase [Paenibacillus campi]|uniref:aldo/keto reductase n=1 Tax=Paenibacillus campi TaxID=3106031 RepID=UPI002AFFDEC8|nr:MULTISPECIES: aldo/keto reductase [unclassified Paenibacillus]